MSKEEGVELPRGMATIFFRSTEARDPSLDPLQIRHDITRQAPLSKRSNQVVTLKKQGYTVGDVRVPGIRKKILDF